MACLRFILGDQLTHSLSALQDLDPARDVVLMVEVADEATYVRHHRQKLVLVLSAMRHFAAQLRSEGIAVDYVCLDDEANTGALTTELARALAAHDVERIVVTQPGEWRVLKMIETWEERFGIPVEVREDDRFLCSIPEFEDWARGRKSLRMEYFYRQMRRQTGWLMDGDKPIGGTWNFDAKNRRPLKDTVELPFRRRFPADTLTRGVVALVEKAFPDHFGDLDTFAWGTTREDALGALDDFISHGLECFGDYQDAMKSGEDFLFHALLSPYLNIGLLTATEVCESVLAASVGGGIPLNATEGFIRQVIGWREYVRGIYWSHMPSYAKGNFLDANRSLPRFYWTGETDMRCLSQVVCATRQNAYAHHIQRLMVTGNFALLAGLSPSDVEEWYLAVYTDAYEWVELPNTHGMTLFADGGLLASKPYAASGAYINRMSDYCRGCSYDPKQKLGAAACPFNYLYWQFMIRNESRLSNNPRMGMSYRTLRAMPAERREETMHRPKHF